MNPQDQQLVSFLTANGIRWVHDQRERYRAAAEPIPEYVRARLTPYFAQSTLDSARVIEVPEIANPPFFSAFTESGLPLPLDFRQMAGITFGDTILVASSHQVPGEPIESLMFHELVHVIQYSALGVDEFIRRYVIGWANAAFDYFRIPLEEDAYDLQGAFERNLAPISVEAEVLRRLRSDGVEQ
jgi:hypothetical protein